jgi:hypothetical protein
MRLLGRTSYVVSCSPEQLNRCRCRKQCGIGTVKISTYCVATACEEGPVWYKYGTDAALSCALKTGLAGRLGFGLDPPCDDAIPCRSLGLTH